MKIAIDFRMVNSSGIGTVIKKLVPRLVAAHPESDFYLLGREQEIPSLLKDSRNVCSIFCSSLIYSLSEQFELLAKIPSEIDLFWSPHYNIPLFYRGRLLVTVHDVFHLAMPQYVKGFHRRLYARVLFLAIKRHAAGIICDSHFTARELHYYAGVDPKAITVIHNGMDAASAFNEPAPVGDRPYLLFVGNVKPHKNLHRLVLAFESIAGQIPHDLIIVGKKDGFITGDGEAQNAASRMAGRIRFTGHIDDHALAGYYAHADALILPSLYEGFGFPPLEAMRYGVPAMVSDRASLPEVCGDAALYCNPENIEDIAKSLVRIVSDQKLRGDLRKKGLQRIGTFSWDKCADLTWQAILDAAAPPLPAKR